MKMALKTHGITKETPTNLLLGAGAFYKNLKYIEGRTEVETVTDEDGVETTVENVIEGRWEEEGVIGATTGGGTIRIEPEYLQPEIDGASVAVRGLTFKVGEVASIEVTLAELSKDVLKDTLHLREESTTAEGYTKLISAKQIDESDHLDSIGYVGTLADGRQIIFILPNAICKGALEMNPQNKQTASYAVTFEASATFEQESLDYLPYEIYYPEYLPTI